MENIFPERLLENEMESNGRRGLPAKILCNKLDEAKIENSKRLVRKYEQVIELIFFTIRNERGLCIE